LQKTEHTKTLPCFTQQETAHPVLESVATCTHQMMLVERLHNLMSSCLIDLNV